MRKYMVLCLVGCLILGFSQTTLSAEKIKVAVYNAEEVGGQSAGETGIMMTLQEIEDFSPESITDLSLGTLMKYDVLILPDVHSVGRQPKGWQLTIVKYVAGGGGVMLTHDNVGFRAETTESLFPDVVRGRSRSETRGIEPVIEHPTTTGIIPFETTYYDHITVIPGPEGILVLKDSDGKGACVAGTHGRGKVVAMGLVPGISAEGEEAKAVGGERRLLENGVRWLVAELGWLERWAQSFPVEVSSGKYLYQQPEPVLFTLRTWSTKREGMVKAKAALVDKEGRKIGKREVGISLSDATLVPGTRVYTKREEITYPTKDVADGEYKVICEIGLPTGEKSKAESLPFDLIGQLVRTIERKAKDLEEVIRNVRAKAKADDSPLLALRGLDVEIREENARHLFGEFSEKEDLDGVLRQLKEGEVIGQFLLKGEIPSKTSRYALVRMAGDLGAETVWESSLSREGWYQIGVYYAGIPIAHIDYNRFPTPEELNQRLEGWFEWDRERGHQIAEKALGEYKAYVVTEEGRLRFLDLVRGTDLYVLQAVNEEVGWRLAQELVSLDGITAEEIEEMHATIEPNPTVDAEHISEILDFDYASSVMVVGEKAGKGELTLARELKVELSGEVLSEKELGDQKHLILVGTGESNDLIRAYESDGALSYPHKDQGLLTYRSIGDKRVIIVAGGEERLVVEAGRILLNLITVLKGRQLLVGDLHMHSTHSDGVSPPITVAKATMRNFVDFAAITDHNTPEGSLEAIREAQDAGVNYTLLPGQETTTSWAHIATIGCVDTISWTLPPEETMRSIHESGGIAIFAHPGSPESGWADSTLKGGLFSDVDAFEARARTPEFYGRWKMLERLPSLVSSTDSHSTTFSYPARTIVFVEEDSPEAIIEAIKEGYCLGYAMDKVYGPDALLDVFNALFEEGEYLKGAHMKRLASRVRSLY